MQLQMVSRSDITSTYRHPPLHPLLVVHVVHEVIPEHADAGRAPGAAVENWAIIVDTVVATMMVWMTASRNLGISTLSARSRVLIDCKSYNKATRSAFTHEQTWTIYVVHAIQGMIVHMHLH